MRKRSGERRKRIRRRGSKPLTRQLQNRRSRNSAGRRRKPSIEKKKRKRIPRNISDGLHFLSSPTKRYEKGTLLEVLEDYKCDGVDGSVSAKKGDILEVIFHNRYNFKNIIVRNTRTQSIGTFSCGLVREKARSERNSSSSSVQPNESFSSTMNLEGSLPMFFDSRTSSSETDPSERSPVMEHPRRYTRFAIPKFAVGDLNGVRVSRTRRYGIIEEHGNFIKILDENQKLLYLPKEFFDVEETQTQLPSPNVVIDDDSNVVQQPIINPIDTPDDPFEEHETEQAMNYIRDQKAEIISLETRQEEIEKDLDNKWSELEFLEGKLTEFDENYKKSEKNKQKKKKVKSEVEEEEEVGEGGGIVESSSSTDLLECKICFENNISFGLSCGHTICEICVDNIKKRRMACPFCRKKINFKKTLKLFIT